MVTVVSTNPVKELQPQQEIGQPQALQWHYCVPSPGVRYYGFSPAPSPAQDADPWSLEGIISPTDVDQD